jgi:hypothetical protein
MSERGDPVDEPDDGGERPSVQPRRGEDIPRKEAVGDFGDEERADPGGDSDVDPVEGGEER